jgi:hypothetical protein
MSRSVTYNWQIFTRTYPQVVHTHSTHITHTISKNRVFAPLLALFGLKIGQVTHFDEFPFGTSTIAPVPGEPTGLLYNKDVSKKKKQLYRRYTIKPQKHKCFLCFQLYSYKGVSCYHY